MVVVSHNVLPDAGGGSASSVEVGSAVPQAVEEDRKHIVEAVLVRVH